MNVKELIEELSQLDPELMVVIRGYEGGVKEVSHYELCNVALNVNKEWYYGNHETLTDKELVEIKNNASIAKGVQLH